MSAVAGSGGARRCHFQTAAIEVRQALPSRHDGRLGIAIVRRGLLIRLREDGLGRVAAVDVVGPGQAFRTGVTHPGTQLSGHTVMGYAASRTLICFGARHDLTDAPGLQQAYELLMQSTDRMERFVMARARATAESRVASLLCALQDSLEPRTPGPIPASIRQQDMASLLALRHESVCRSLRVLRERGLITRDSDGIRILSRCGLERL